MFASNAILVKAGVFDMTNDNCDKVMRLVHELLCWLQSVTLKINLTIPLQNMELWDECSFRENSYQIVRETWVAWYVSAMALENWIRNEHALKSKIAYREGQGGYVLYSSCLMPLHTSGTYFGDHYLINGLWCRQVLTNTPTQVL